MVKLYVPAMHLLHEEEFDAPVEALYVPAAHRRHALEEFCML